MEEVKYIEAGLPAAIYERRVNYYETDQMGIVHHSNYIRWFEEARLYFMEEAGVPYKQMEDDGIMSPVLGVSATYKVPAKYGQKVLIYVWIESFNGIRMRCAYKVVESDTGALCATGTSDHCFVNMEFKPISLKKSYPLYYQLIQSETGERAAN